MFAFGHLFEFVMGIDPEEKSSVVDLLEDRMGHHPHSKRGRREMPDLNECSEAYLIGPEKSLDRFNRRCLQELNQSWGREDSDVCLPTG